MSKTGVENQQGLEALGLPILRLVPLPVDGVEMLGAVAGHFPHLKPTPKPWGGPVPDRSHRSYESTSSSTHKGMPFVAGERNGRLISVQHLRLMKGGPYWEFRCDCGGTIHALFADVRRGTPRSCRGCR